MSYGQSKPPEVVGAEVEVMAWIGSCFPTSVKRDPSIEAWLVHH